MTAKLGKLRLQTEEDVLAAFDSLVAYASRCAAEREAMEQRCREAEAEVAFLREETGRLKEQLFRVHSSVLRRINEIDEGCKDAIERAAKAVDGIEAEARLAEASHALEVAKWSQRSAERDAAMLRSEAAALGTEVRLLRARLQAKEASPQQPPQR
jgi:predicted  nucleic acid-binding Zn-ribbon protein